MCRTQRRRKPVDPSEAARALRAIPSEIRADASRANGRHGGRPRHPRDAYVVMMTGPGCADEGDSAGVCRTLDDCEAIARQLLQPGQGATAYRQGHGSPSARWLCEAEAGKIRRVMV